MAASPQAQNPTPRNSNPRKSNYTIDEDRHLCRVYMDISQKLETGVYHRKDQFWIRVMESFNSEKSSPLMSDRNRRSIECRMQIILNAVSKFKECTQQVEYLNPTEQDVHNRAQELMMLDPKFPKGFKFEHVWSIMKDFDCTSQKSRRQMLSSQSDMVPESPVSRDRLPESPVSPDRLSSFSLNLCDDNDSGSEPSQRPEDVKKSILKRKKYEDMSVVINTIREEHQKIRDLIESSTTKKDDDIQVQMQKIEAQKQNAAATMRLAEVTQWASDTNILMIDIETISDPNRRGYFQNEQARIISKRKEQLH